MHSRAVGKYFPVCSVLHPITPESHQAPKARFLTQPCQLLFHHHHHHHVHKGLGVFILFLAPLNEVGPSISSLVGLRFFVLLVYIVVLVLILCLCPSSVRVVATFPGIVLFPLLLLFHGGNSVIQVVHTLISLYL
jgi:hypothetical protein